jgi:hypothetical protein
MEFARRGELRDLNGPVRNAAQGELIALGVPPQACGEIITAMIHVEMTRRSGVYASEPHRRAVGGYRDGRRWVQSGNAFVTILQKNDLTDNESDPAGIMSCLSDALLSWRPNLVQILISEIQNILELEALATADDQLREPETQTALWYYLLDSLGPIDVGSTPDVSVPLMSVIDKIVDGIRRRLSSDPELLTLASQALLGELRDVGWTNDNWPKPRHKEMIPASMTMARTEGLVTGPNTLFRLNSFFSTELFRRAHLTTGTVFHDPAKNQFFVAASPACDLVARQPGANQVWAHAIHPLAPIVAILLHGVDSNAALNEAENGLHVFLESGVEKKAFKLVNDSGQPSYEFLFAKNEGRVRGDGGKIVFDAVRLAPQLAAANPTAKNLLGVVSLLQAETGVRLQVARWPTRRNSNRAPLRKNRCAKNLIS